MDRAMSDALVVQKVNVVHFSWQNISDFIEKGVCHASL